MTVVWHDLECGGYLADLPLWRRLATRHGDPVLDIGAGTGRTALALALEGHSVTALDLDPELLAELRARAGGLGLQNLDTVQADAREFHLPGRFALCIVPMQTIQLLGGAGGRASFLLCAREHLRPGGVLAVALADELELFEVSDGAASPLPDICELDGVVYCSRPTAVRADGDGFLLARRREVVSADGRLTAEENLIRLDGLDAWSLEREGQVAGFSAAERMLIAPTEDHVGSVVVTLGA